MHAICEKFYAVSCREEWKETSLELYLEVSGKHVLLVGHRRYLYLSSQRCMHLLGTLQSIRKFQYVR